MDATEYRRIVHAMVLGARAARGACALALAALHSAMCHCALIPLSIDHCAYCTVRRTGFATRLESYRDTVVSTLYTHVPIRIKVASR